jgi:hypothetical protein
MCVIVDANLASAVFGDPTDADFVPVLHWLREGKGSVVYGGQLAEELRRVESARIFLAALNQAGGARPLKDEEVCVETKRLRKTGQVVSDDPHVIALARLSGARTLCSRDKTLHADFKNKRLIDNPRGAIYQDPSHWKHLRHTSSCGK